MVDTICGYRIFSPIFRPERPNVTNLYVNNHFYECLTERYCSASFWASTFCDRYLKGPSCVPTSFYLITEIICQP